MSQEIETPRIVLQRAVAEKASNSLRDSKAVTKLVKNIIIEELNKDQVMSVNRAVHNWEHYLEVERNAEITLSEEQGRLESLVRAETLRRNQAVIEDNSGED